jgi:hypothetical protein
MAIDIITGKVFQPKFQGQRTAVDLEAIMDGEGVSAAGAVEIALAERHADNAFYNTTPASLQAEYDRMHEAALRSDPNAERHIVSAEEAAQAAGRTARAAEGLMGSLQGGGANAFLRTESGLGNWRAMDADGNFGTQPTLNGVDYNVVPEDPAWVAAHVGEIVEPGAGGTVGAGGDMGAGGGGGASSIRAKMQSAFYLALREAGMDKTTIDSLWTWAETQWTNDPSFTAERALIGMYDQQAFKDRFKGIDLMTQGGVGRRDLPTPGEYIRFEKYVASELSRVGVVEPDFDTLITNLFVNSVGDAEVTERLNVAQQVMWNMPPEVRDKLTDWFGTEYGTSITMKTFLDNTGDWSKIQDDISTARTGGWGQMVAGLDAGWDKDLAKKVSDLGLSQAEQWSRFAELKEQEMLFSETLNETVDLDYAKEGVEAQFGLDTGSSELVDRRAARRSADFSGGGGAMLTGTTTGFGAANA